MSKRHEFVNQMKEQIDLLNRQVDDIEVKLKSASSDVKGRLSGKLEDLKEKQQHGKEVLAKIVDSGEDSWEGLKEQAVKTRKAFEHSVHYFMSQMK